jgi:hypothetical protein
MEHDDILGVLAFRRSGETEASRLDDRAVHHDELVMEDGIAVAKYEGEARFLSSVRETSLLAREASNIDGRRKWEWLSIHGLAAVLAHISVCPAVDFVLSRPDGRWTQ